MNKTTLILGLCCLSLFQCSLSQVEEDRKTAKVIKDALVETVQAGGHLESTNSVHISCPKVPGVYEFTVSFLAPEGKPIKQGTPVIGFKTDQLRERLQMRQASLASDRKSLEKIRLDEQETLENLMLEEKEKAVAVAKAQRKMDVPVGLESRRDVETNKRDLQLAEAQREMAETKVTLQKLRMEGRIKAQESRIKRLESEVRQLEAAIAAMTVKAPRDGLVVYKEDWRGDKVAMGDRVWFGRSIMELPDLTQMRVQAAIDEPDAGRVHVGQPVEIRLDSNPDRVFMGKITELGKIFHKKSRQKPSIVFDAWISIDEPDQDIMRPGMAAKIRIRLGKEDEVLQLDERALFYVDDTPTVTVVTGRGERRQKVSLGRRAGGFAEVLSGLKEGDEVVLLENGEEDES